MRGSLEVFLVYLVSRDRAIADVLASNPQLLATAFEEQFCGMMSIPVTVQELDETCSSMISLIHSWLLERHKGFLPGFKCGEPNWALLYGPGVVKLSAVQWKQMNIARMAPEKRHQAVERLQRVLYR
jgi:hypothetical protein